MSAITGPNDEAERILRRHEGMVSQRANWESLWREIADRILPRESFFQQNNAQVAEGQRKTQRLFDSTGQLALNRFAAAMESMLTPRTQKWHKLKVRGELENDAEVKEYLDEVNDILFAARYAPKANFASQMHEVYINLGAFGNGAINIDEMMGVSLTYRSVSVYEAFIAVNAAGLIDTFHRPMELTARQAVQRFGAANPALPEKIKTSAQSDPDAKFDFLHCVKPNEEYDDRRLDYRGMRFGSAIVSILGKTIVQRGGYRTFPYPFGRYTTNSKETYGRSVAMDALPSLLTLNEQKKTVLRAGQKVVDPPLMLADDGALAPFDLRSSALNYGTLARDGEPLVKPLETKGRVELGIDLMEQEQLLINHHFLVTLFQILVENDAMTATEALLRAQEKGALLAPTMGRQQSELLGPMIERELDLLQNAGQLPPMPEKLAAAGGIVEIEYDSPLTRAQRAGEGTAILNLFTQVAPIAEVKPDVLDKIDFDEAIDVLAAVNGVPQKVIVTGKELEALREARAQGAQKAEVLEAAPIAAGAAKDLANAQQMAGAAPPVPLPT